MKRLRANRKAVVGWTLFFHLVLLVVVVRYRLTRFMQKPWAEDIARSVEESRERAPRPPDPAVPEDENVSDMILQAREDWDGRTPEERERALENRERQLERISPERVDQIVDRINRSTGAPTRPTREVPLSELDLSTSVPIHMQAGNDDAGQPGVWVHFQDEQGRVAQLWVEEDQLSPEEIRALRAFSLMDRHPALQGLRPVLFDMLRRFATPES
ncbi:MAG: hypothetical protein JJU29_16525 [Verrucomicrobia bacterium]|nr:hypothetical protein [Verrucomicrobiota bacterium]MCH8513683.1 hypothetical protein [Kiritimatiellia bacterium]